MVEPLKRVDKIVRKGPTVLVIMDGVGFGKYKEGMPLHATPKY